MLALQHFQDHLIYVPDVINVPFVTKREISKLGVGWELKKVKQGS